jgi:hypothetical protein
MGYQSSVGICLVPAAPFLKCLQIKYSTTDRTPAMLLSLHLLHIADISKTEAFGVFGLAALHRIYMIYYTECTELALCHAAVCQLASTPVL